MRHYTLIGMTDGKCTPLAMPDMDASKQLALRNEILTNDGLVPKSKVKLDVLFHFSSDGVKINRFGNKITLNPKAAKA